MAGKNTEKQSPDSQIAKFKKAARAAGCDESEESFKKKLKAVLRPKPASTAKKRGNG